ncbi:MAG TPA: hypothetical protein PLN48_15135, partial [Lachnospiraceae bacterium]|nr:hypothetical protein [Lachnospiraceae bacterium]
AVRVSVKKILRYAHGKDDGGSQCDSRAARSYGDRGHRTLSIRHIGPFREKTTTWKLKKREKSRKYSNPTPKRQNPT